MAVLKWISKTFGSGATAVDEPKEGAWLLALRAWLIACESKKRAPLAKGMASEIWRFVATGENPGLLDRIATDPGMGTALGVLVDGYHGGVSHGRCEVPLDLYGVMDAPAATVLRWARVLEASVIEPSRQRGSRVAFFLDMPDHSHWAEIFVAHACGSELGLASNHYASPQEVSHELLDAMAAEAGQAPGTLLAATFGMAATRYSGHRYRARMVAAIKGFEDALATHSAALTPVLARSEPEQRALMIELLEKGDARVSVALASLLADWATATSRALRTMAQILALRAGDGIIEPLMTIARTAKPEQRALAFRLLWQIAGDNTQERDRLRDMALADKAPGVRALPEEWEVGEASLAVPSALGFERPVIDWSTPAGLAARVDTFFAAVNARIDAENRQRVVHHQKMSAAGAVTWQPQQEALFTGDQIKAAQERLKSPPTLGETGARAGHTAMAAVYQQLAVYAGHDGVTPQEVYRILAYFGAAAVSHGMLETPACTVFTTMRRKTGHPTLLELAVMGEAYGAAPEGLLRNICSWTAFASDWPADSVWPYMVDQQQAAADLLQNTPRDFGYWFKRQPLYRALATLPVTSPLVVNTLFEVALGTAKADRQLAQAALDNLPGKEARIISALRDGKAEIRAVAANWLGRLRQVEAVEPLAEAVMREKQDVAKGAMLDALQALGQPVDRFLNRGALAGEARKSLAKGLPKDLETFPWDLVPTVRWADSAEPVDTDILRWMIAQAVKQKLPEPNAVLRKYCAMFDPRDAERLGQFVLEAWIAEDLHPIDADTAMAQAAAHARQFVAVLKNHPQYYVGHRFEGKSEQEIYAATLPSYLRTPRGSATTTKGMLAVAAACAGGAAADVAGRYLKEYYGTRAAQGKALIAMLAWIEHPSAIQLMLSIGSRFRTKSFQEEASRQARALADRKDWTLDELADRTIPSAGFDEEGTLELPYGERVFTARLLAGLQLELRSPEGKTIKSLPVPRQDDDAEQAKASKQAWAAAKKSLKAVADLQAERLYEALCTEREWAFADWDRYFNRHAVMGQLVRRLAWAVVVDGRVVQVFRPLDDGSLTDVDDGAVELAADARVRLAHDSLLEPAVVEAWAAHFADYEVAPLFQQFGKGTFRLPDTDEGVTKIMAFEGHLTETFRLRGRMTKLGYTRGPTGDGGWFFTYVKRFPTLGITAHIEFTGNGLPETNRTVALEALSFTRVVGEGAPALDLSLTQVPAILLSECYNDLRLAAGDGSGYDADWQKKIQY